MLTLADLWGLTLVNLPTSAALAAVALIGYLFGQRTRRAVQTELDSRRQRELERAACIARQLETIADTLRKNLAAHHSQVELFKRRLRQAQQVGSEQAWQELCAEAETILGPTMQLAHKISHAYDQIRRQSDALETFTQGRTDPLTGVGNGRALQQQLDVLLPIGEQGKTELAVAMVRLDPGPTTAGSANAVTEPSAPRLQQLASVIRSCMRDTDFVARFGDDEFIVVMPQTSQAGASIFGDRVRACTPVELNATICCGIATATAADDAKSLLARADSALYSAKATGPNRLFVHTGAHIREHRSPPDPVASKPPSPPQSPGVQGHDSTSRTNDDGRIPGNWSDQAADLDAADEMALPTRV